MAHVAFVCPPLRGHLDPTVALARTLAARGHRISLISDAMGFAQPPGIALVDPGLPASGGLREAVGRRAGVLGTVAAMAQRFEQLADRLPPLLDRLGVDCVVADQTEPAGALAAALIGVPYASLACALPLNREAGLPPPFVDWEHRPDGIRRWLYAGGHRVTDWLMRPLNRAIGRRAREWRIGGIDNLDATFSPSLQILQLAKALDFAREDPPPNAHWVGPLRLAEAGSDRIPEAMRPRDGRPLAFCSLGSLQGFRAGLLQTIARSVAECGLRPVVAHGGLLDRGAAAAFPADAIVADFLPQRAVLAEARLAVLHGGLNSVLDALAACVPLVITPLAYEQGGVAARVAASGAGLVVDPGKARRTLTDACRRILTAPAFREKAAILARQIAAGGGAARAADLVEALAVGRSLSSPAIPACSACGPGPR